MGNRITDRLGIVHPIIQAPMLGAVTSKMVAAANRADCLGSLPLGDADYQICLEKIRATKKETNKPFAVNLFVNDIPPINQALKKNYNRTRSRLKLLADELGFSVDFPDIEEIQPKGYKQQIPAILEEECKILSFTFGIIDAETIQLLHDNNTILIGTCNSLEEAKTLEQKGIDLICVQGIEAGGHRGTSKNTNIPTNTGFALLQSVKSSIQTPIIYAGGIKNKDSIKALETLGAEGFQVGTLLLCSQESALSDFQKERLTTLVESEVILTNSFTGRYASGIKNLFTKMFDNTDYILPYPYQNKLTKAFREGAKRNKETEWLSIWVGQSFQNLSFGSTEQILKDLI